MGTEHRFSTLPAVDAASSPARSVPLRRLTAFFRRVEDLGPDATGALLFACEARDVGALLIERGRVCWAATPEMRARFTALICDQSEGRLAPEQVRAVYKRCIESGEPLGQTLVADGVVSDEGLRRVLRQHNAEAVALLSLPGRVATWHPRPDHSYDPRFSFTPAELYVSVGALANVPGARVARSRLRALASPPNIGAGFIVTGHELLPVAEVNGSAISVAQLQVLEGWLGELAQTTTLGMGAPRLSLLRTESDQCALGWFEGCLAFAVLSAHSQQSYRLMSRLVHPQSGEFPLGLTANGG